MSIRLSEAYRIRYDAVLKPSARNLEALLIGRLSGAKRIDRIYARPKSIESFLTKAAKKINKVAKYTDPMAEIHDQLAARVIVLFRDDIDSTADLVLKYFAKAEQTTKEPESDWAFGYFGVHLLLPTPVEVIPPDVDSNLAPPLFELQIRTLFQHAWAETNHDLGYKPDTNLSSEEKRKLAFTSAQSWGADQIFSELHKVRCDAPP